MEWGCGEPGERISKGMGVMDEGVMGGRVGGRADGWVSDWRDSGRGRGDSVAPLRPELISQMCLVVRGEARKTE